MSDIHDNTMELGEFDYGPPCPWSWHGLPCALRRAHSTPHHIVGEQPQFDAVLEPLWTLLAEAVEIVASHDFDSETEHDGFIPRARELLRRTTVT